MNFNKKKVIIADVDGTVCESCQPLSAEMSAEITRLIQNGFVFAFISGTKKDYLLGMITSRLNEKHYLLPTTGTVCVGVDGQNQVELYKYILTAAEKEEILAALEKTTLKFNIKSLTTKEDQIQDRETQVTLSAIGRSAPQELKAKYDPNGQKRRTWIRHLQTLLDVQKYEINIAGTTSMDITRKGLDKGWGIIKFAQQQGIPLSSIIFLGDKTEPGGNDYPATTVVDFVTVRNPQETLEILRRIAPANHCEER